MRTLHIVIFGFVLGIGIFLAFYAGQAAERKLVNG